MYYTHQGASLRSVNRVYTHQGASLRCVPWYTSLYASLCHTPRTHPVYTPYTPCTHPEVYPPREAYATYIPTQGGIYTKRAPESPINSVREVRRGSREPLSKVIPGLEGSREPLLGLFPG